MSDSLWNRVQHLEGRDMYTLAKHAGFRIVSVDERQAELRLHSTRGRALVRRNFLEPMWEDLRATKRIVINEWKAESILPGKDWVTKYAAPILAELEEVRVVTGAGGVALVLGD